MYLNEVPFGLHVDEVGMAYDSFALANWGVDRWLNSYPVYLINFGAGQSALYAYMSMILIKLFGLSIYTIRLPGVIVSIITFFVGYKTVSEILNSKYYGILFSFLFTILPYFIMQSRFGLDCNLMMGMSSIVLYFVNKMIKTDCNKYSFLAGLFSGLILYTYALSYLVMPIFLFIVFITMAWTKSLTFKKILYFVLPLTVLALPLILMVMINSLKMESVHFMNITLPRLPNFRGSGFTLSKVVENFKLITRSVFMHDQLTYNSLSQFYTMYRLSIPFVLVGIFYGFLELFKSIKSRVYSPILIYWIFAFSVFMMGILLEEQLNTNKMNGIFYAILILLIYGIYAIEQIIKSIFKSRFAVPVFYLLILSIYAISFVGFARYYYFEYKYDIYPQTLFSNPFTEELEYVKSNNLNNDPVYTENNIDSNFQGHIFFLLSAQISPYEYNLGKRENGFNNYSFGMPEIIDTNAYYIVNKSNNEFIQMIEGFQLHRVEFDNFYVYEPK
jgi:4-amino-4-deoxy-L-arabinose transferase-like glycosyltransferase